MKTPWGQCAARARTGLRCQKRARNGLHTCTWHAVRESRFEPPALEDGGSEVQSSHAGSLVALTSAIRWDEEFRNIVGLEPATYWVWVDPTSGWSCVHDAPPATDSLLAARVQHRAAG